MTSVDSKAAYVHGGHDDHCAEGHGHSHGPSGDHGHSHGSDEHAHSHGEVGVKTLPWYKQSTARKFVFMCLLITIMFFMELIGGLESGSLALVSDAFHMLSDGMSLIVAVLCFSLSKRKPSDKLSFGWERAEVLGGLINGVILVAVCVFIVIEAIHRLIEPPVIDQPEIVISVGCVSLLFNLLGMCMFHQAGHHGHSHSHGGGGHGGHEDMNIKAIFLHILGDALASIAVIISGTVVYATEWEGKYYIDPFVSMVISAIILYGTLPLIKRASFVLLQWTPDEMDVSNIKRDILAVEGVQGVHHLHVWQLFKKKVVATVHIGIGDHVNYSEVVGRVDSVFHSHGIHSSTIQPEPLIRGCNAKCGLECASSMCCHPDSHHQHIVDEDGNEHAEVGVVVKKKLLSTEEIDSAA